MAGSEQLIERGLTREEIIQKFPPKIEMAYPREDRVKQGLVSPEPVEFMVSRNEAGMIVFAMGAEGFYKSLENTGEGSESEVREAAGVHYGMNIDEGLVIPAPYTIHPDGHHNSVSKE